MYLSKTRKIISKKDTSKYLIKMFPSEYKGTNLFRCIYREGGGGDKEYKRSLGNVVNLHFFQ